MTYAEKAKIKEDLKVLHEVKNKIKGNACEVYSRVCGYLRPTQYWNGGKKEEYKKRKLYKVC